MTDSIPVKVYSNLNEKKIALVEAVLNLPAMIRFSKIEFIIEKYDKVYIGMDGIEENDSIPSIIQNGKPLNVWHNTDSLKNDTPCYVFDKIEIHGDSAYVLLKFEITGAIAFGSLGASDG